MKIAHISDLHLRHSLPGTSAVSRRLSRRIPGLLEKAVQAIAAHEPDLVAVTGDLVDYPLYAMNDDDTMALGEKDLSLVRDFFAPLACPVMFTYGNHDHPGSFRRVFAGIDQDIDVAGHRVLTFLDDEIENHYAQRLLGERKRFLEALADDDPRPQIHLQHYLMAPSKNRGYPHSYREAESMRLAVAADPRVRLVLSGHYHRGGRVLTEGGTRFSAVPAFCVPPHPYRIYSVTRERIDVRNHKVGVADPARKRAVFLDRDGVINPQASYRTGPEPFRLIPGVGQALGRLSRAGFALVIITNQTAVGRGFITTDMVAATNDKMASLLIPFGVELDGVYCRHHLPDAAIPRYRTDQLETKPSPAMLYEAAEHLDLDVANSFMVGDRKTDLEAGRNAGCQGTILVRTGEGVQMAAELSDGEADTVVDDLAAAADWILQVSRLLFILGVSIGSIVVGYLTQRALTARDLVPIDRLRTVSRLLKLASFFFMNPIAVLSTFWGMTLPSRSVLAFPLLGLLAILIGAVGAFATIRLLKVPPKKAGSVFTCGAFSNVVTFGGLIVFTLFKEPGYALMQLFTMFMSPTYYMVGYPVSSNIARGDKHVFRISWKNLKENPYLLIPATAIVAGLTMKFTGLPRPALFGGLIAILVPVVTGALGIAIGLTLTFSRIRDYRREIAIVLLIRHVLLPVVMIPIALALGFHRVAEGMPFKAIIILSAMPVAFNALVPPAIYGFDLDLANSAWIVSTASLVVLMPLFFFLFS